MARAYLEFYERFVPQRAMLDSALFYLVKAGKEEEKAGNRDLIRLHFLAGDFAKATSFAARNPADVKDAWTAYHLGESFVQQGRLQDGAPWYQRAVAIMPHALDFQNKWGTCLLSLGQIQDAREVFAFILSENPQHAAAHDNLGYCLLQTGDRIGAYEHFSQSLRLDPDRPQTLLNLAVYYYQIGDKPAAARMLKRILKKDPQHERARAMLADLEGGV
jgi:tetratricopeptide (TPR) repeat protein